MMDHLFSFFPFSLFPERAKRPIHARVYRTCLFVVEFRAFSQFARSVNRMIIDHAVPLFPVVVCFSSSPNAISAPAFMSLLPVGRWPRISITLARGINAGRVESRGVALLVAIRRGATSRGSSQKRKRRRNETRGGEREREREIGGTGRGEQAYATIVIFSKVAFTGRH